MSDAACHCDEWKRDAVVVRGICILCNPGTHLPHRQANEYEPAYSWAKQEFRDDMRKARDEATK